jgi:hypothetical protein
MNLRIVAWRDVWRVVDDLGRVLAVCETYAEAEAYIAGQIDGADTTA